MDVIALAVAMVSAYAGFRLVRRPRKRAAEPANNATDADRYVSDEEVKEILRRREW